MPTQNVTGPSERLLWLGHLKSSCIVLRGVKKHVTVRQEAEDLVRS